MTEGQSLAMTADMEKSFYVYIMSNKWNTVLYTGVTNDLLRRVQEHKGHQEADSFTAKYNLEKLVYFEVASDAYTAISREKQIKGGSRSKKLALVKAVNPDWKDLTDELIF